MSRRLWPAVGLDDVDSADHPAGLSDGARDAAEDASGIVAA